MKNTPSYRTIDILKFLIPSLIGILLFMFPISYNDEITIPIAILSGELQELLGGTIPYIMTAIITITAIATVFTKLAKPSYTKRPGFFNALLNVSLFWTITRIVGMVFAIMTLFKLGPEAVWSEATGGLLLFELLPILLTVFLFAGLFLPLLLDYGLLEFFGALLTKIMRPVFTLPGRSSIDTMASWLGDGTIGVLLTSKQYEEGYYTKREAAVIGTTFSVVSITFSLIVISQVGLEEMFVPFYATVALSGLVAAIIMPRIPPLSWKPDTYYNGEEKEEKELIPEGYSPLKWGYTQAVERAAKNRSVSKFFIEGGKNVLDMWMGVAPIVMAFGTIALVLAENTPLFTWLGVPFIPLLELLQIPEAKAASETMMVGFADMFLPSVLGADIQSELTRFVVATVSVTQLIYLSEVGGVLLGSKVPVSFKDLFIIFILRTLITLPVIAIMGHIFF
ncbi:nucleoside recognition membrane protein YjiH [Bacillus tianshenii]|uniref:Nucleoside recognition membrane protein YjiH n=1 Tax=Sutcliffiella tianshenii TaxID=1463404 RepID=A0ABS2NVP3_9BACI|nr:nucleoside recognition membrane protein YjiH [Bacillus tianshenii]